MTKQPHANYCGAKTRSGQPCKNRAMANGRCRMHGGKSTGAPGQNKNAVKTGEHESIWMDALEEEERSFFYGMETDILQQLNDDIKLFTIRERRMLKRIQSLTNKDLNVVSHEQRQGVDQGQKSKYDVVKRENAIDQIQRIEEALTRVQYRKAKLLELKHKIEIDIEGDALSKLRIEKTKAEIQKIENEIGSLNEEESKVVIVNDKKAMRKAMIERGCSGKNG